MQAVTLSPKYQVGAPKAVREALHLRPGQKMQVVAYNGRIELIPERDMKELRGFLKDVNTEFESPVRMKRFKQQLLCEEERLWI